MKKFKELAEKYMSEHGINEPINSENPVEQRIEFLKKISKVWTWPMRDDVASICVVDTKPLNKKQVSKLWSNSCLECEEGYMDCALTPFSPMEDKELENKLDRVNDEIYERYEDDCDDWDDDDWIKRILKKFSDDEIAKIGEFMISQMVRGEICEDNIDENIPNIEKMLNQYL